MFGTTWAAALVSALSLTGSALALPSRVPRDTSSGSLQTWKNGFNIHTDYDFSVPPGVTRKYELTITNTTIPGPDGVQKKAMLINGQYPGPKIEADWGDYLEITVNNQLQDNGTSIHWHGIRMLNTGTMDGVNGVTECPIPPGGSRVYSFKATQYGTSWYHSHFSVQYGDGVVGTIQINGPASADYDIDLGTFPITDWYHRSADSIMLETGRKGPPPSDNILFNGTNINVSGSGGSGEYARVKLTAGKKHRLRLINTSVDNTFTLSLIGHKFTIIAADFVPVQPKVVEQLYMSIGQRYDIIIEADQASSGQHYRRAANSTATSNGTASSSHNGGGGGSGSGSGSGSGDGLYWFNATVPVSGYCGDSKNPYPAAIFYYDGASTTGLPTETGTNVTATCDDEITDLQPIVSRTAPKANFVSATTEQHLDVNITQVVTSSGDVFKWTVNSSSISTNWDKPVLQTVGEMTAKGVEGEDEIRKFVEESFPASDNLIVVPQKDGEWSFWVIDNIGGVLPHPIHLHGHDFLVLGHGTNGQFADNAAANLATLNFANPVRRDVTVLPGSGWLALAFQIDNPGAWLMHCHIAWHISEGLGVNFLEEADKIPASYSLDDLSPQCASWKAYNAHAPYPKTDSGL